VRPGAAEATGESGGKQVQGCSREEEAFMLAAELNGRM
jgi:hypothetical protein